MHSVSSYPIRGVVTIMDYTNIMMPPRIHTSNVWIILIPFILILRGGMFARYPMRVLLVCLFVFFGNLFSSGFNPSCIFALYSLEGS